MGHFCTEHPIWYQLHHYTVNGIVSWGNTTDLQYMAGDGTSSMAKKSSNHWGTPILSQCKRMRRRYTRQNRSQSRPCKKRKKTWERKTGTEVTAHFNSELRESNSESEAHDTKYERVWRGSQANVHKDTGFGKSSREFTNSDQASATTIASTSLRKYHAKGSPKVLPIWWCEKADTVYSGKVI